MLCTSMYRVDILLVPWCQTCLLQLTDKALESSRQPSYRGHSHVKDGLPNAYSKAGTRELRVATLEKGLLRISDRLRGRKACLEKMRSC